MKVLIADDDETSRIALHDILRRLEGIAVHHARDGQEALDMLNARLRPDLCMFDIRMPKLDGVQLVRAIRGDPKLHDLRIAITSGNRDREAIVALAGLGICGYLLKPFSAERVLELARAAEAEVVQRLEAAHKGSPDVAPGGAAGP